MKVLLMCAGGMSSSLMAKQVTTYFQKQDQDIVVTATGVGSGKEELKKSAAYDLYLVSPQVRMYFDTVKKLTDVAQKPLAQVPGSAYAPIPKSIVQLGNLILEYLPD